MSASGKYNPRFVSYNLAIFAAGAVLIFLIVAVTLIFAARTQIKYDESIDVARVDTQMMRIYTLLVDAETGQRGYILTHDDSYLVPFDDAKTRFPMEFDALVKNLAAMPSDVGLPDVTRLKEISENKFGEMQHTIDLAKAGGNVTALALVRSGEGKTLMDEARTFVSGFLEATAAVKIAQGADMHGNVRTLIYLTISGVVLLSLLVLGAALLVVRHTKEVVEARAELAIVNAALEETNLDLEVRVRERSEGIMRANEELQRYAYIVSHDLRAPLVNVMGFTGEIEAATRVLADHIKQNDASPDVMIAIDEDIPEALGFIRSSTTRMDGLINEILKLSRLGRRNLEPIQLHMAQLVQTCIESLRHNLDSAGAVIVVEEPLPDVISDRSALEQIFSNLIDNAAKYLDASRAGHIVIRGSVKGAYAIFEVSDNGRGISQNDHERVFELFRRSGALDRPGEGIGLAHVRSLVRRLGGDITIDSDGTTGTTFRMTIARDLRMKMRSELT